MLSIIMKMKNIVNIIIENVNYHENFEFSGKMLLIIIENVAALKILNAVPLHRRSYTTKM